MPVKLAGAIANNKHMDLPSSDLLALFMKLLPGFLAAAVFHALTPYPKRDVFERVVVALIFTLFAQIAVAAIHYIATWIGSKGLVLGTWGDEIELGWGAAAGVFLGVAWAHVVNNGWSHAALRRLGTTKRNSLPTQWFSAFARYDRFVVLQFKDGRRLMGWPTEWPDEPESGHFVLQRAAWVMDDGTKAAMHEIEVYLVCAKQVEAVEFLRFSDDPALAASTNEIQSAHAALAASRKESMNGRPQQSQAADGAERPEPAGDAAASNQ